MSSATQKLSEKQIIDLLQKDDSLAWANLYDEHAGAMYGLVCELTDDTLLADQIFANAFIQLKEQRVFSKIKHSLLSFLLKHTYSYATSFLIQSGVAPKTLKLFTDPQFIYFQTSQPNNKESASLSFSKRN